MVGGALASIMTTTTRTMIITSVHGADATGALFAGAPAPKPAGELCAAVVGTLIGAWAAAQRQWPQLTAFSGATPPPGCVRSGTSPGESDKRRSRRALNADGLSHGSGPVRPGPVQLGPFSCGCVRDRIPASGPPHGVALTCASAIYLRMPLRMLKMFSSVAERYFERADAR